MPSLACAPAERTARMIKEYHAPATIEEALTLKEKLADAAVFLAGGTEINSVAFPLTPEHVISLQGLGLTDLRVTATDLIIGACCTIQQLIDSADIPECLKAAGRHIVNRNIRNMATIGGQLGGNKSCGNLLPVLVALEAVVDLVAPGGTDAIPALEYLAGERKELITHVRIPKSDPPRLVAVEKYSRTANDLSILTAAVSLARDGDVVERPLIAAGGVAKHLTRLEPVEEALNGKPLPSREVIEGLVASHVSPINDIRGSVAFKRHLAAVLVAKTVLRAYLQEEGQRP